MAAIKFINPQDRLTQMSGKVCTVIHMAEVAHTHKHSSVGREEWFDLQDAMLVAYRHSVSTPTPNRFYVFDQDDVYRGYYEAGEYFAPKLTFVVEETV